ncbi:hypothetical protein GQ54DRAFT_299022 [Martensiomyces pterosporus]|nr:hypothetical protein GQ54DRAFT_299022 [Martensiomyces pterosporus]
MPGMSDTNRIQAAAAQGFELDPVGFLDTVTVIVGCVLYGATFLLIAYAWCNHKYQPIRAKNMPLATLMYICGVLWFLGDIPSNQHVNLVGTWANCKAWNLWVRLLFGYLFSCCVLIRAYALHRVFVLRLPFRGWSLVMPIAGAVVCLAVYCLAGQLVPSNVSIHFDSSVQLCVYSPAYQACSLALLWVIWAMIALYVYLIRNIQSSFNELHESLLIFLITLVSLLQTTITPAIHKPLVAKIGVRMSSTWIDFINGNLTIWIVLVHPVYQSVFNRSAYLARWLATLEKDGLKREYEVTGTADLSSTTYSMVHDNIRMLNLPQIHQGYRQDILAMQDQPSALAAPGSVCFGSDGTAESPTYGKSPAIPGQTNGGHGHLMPSSSMDSLIDTDRQPPRNII